MTPSNSSPAGACEEGYFQALKGLEWQLFQSKSMMKKKRAMEQGKAQPDAFLSFQDSTKFGIKSNYHAGTLKRVIMASHMQELPTAYRKIVIGPRDSLDLRKAGGLHSDLLGGRDFSQSSH